MKYFIVGKTSQKEPTYENSGDLNTYYELGRGLMITHPEIKKMKFSELVSGEDFIVTANNE